MIQAGKSYQYTRGPSKGSIDKVLEVDRENKFVKIEVLKGRDTPEAIRASENAGTILYEPGCRYTKDLNAYEEMAASGELVEV